MKLGKKLKTLRGNMTQAELARRSGIDKAIISKLEADKMPGTVKCHTKLAEAFGMKLSEFYAYMENGKPECVEFRPGNTKTDFYEDFLEILTSRPLVKRILPTFITLKPNEEKFLEETLKKVERFLIVIDGQVEIETDGKYYSLKKEQDSGKGDSIYSTSQSRHRLKNTGDKPAVILCVSSPPVL